MLILTRRIGESIVIGDKVTITVTGAKHNEVRLGTTAPRHISVHRKEIYEKELEERESQQTGQTPTPAAQLLHK